MNNLAGKGWYSIKNEKKTSIKLVSKSVTENSGESNDSHRRLVDCLKYFEQFILLVLTSINA